MTRIKNINWPIAIACLSSAALIAMVTAGYLYFSRSNSPIPDNVQKQLNFSPLVTPKSSERNISSSDYKFSRMEDGTKVLTYVISLDTDSITVTEYIQPPQFTEIPDYKDKFLTNVIQQYDSTASANGTIYLGRQSKQNNKQVAVMLERGLMVLMSPNKDLTKDKWRVIGDNLELQKIGN